jgi:hypothetical protein
VRLSPFAPAIGFSTWVSPFNVTDQVRSRRRDVAPREGAQYRQAGTRHLEEFRDIAERVLAGAAHSA